MPYKMRDFTCDCGHTCEALVTPSETVKCTKCGKNMRPALSAPSIFSKIVPTYPGAGARKAGYVHKHTQRPAEKIQIGAGGGVSPNHAKGKGRIK